MSVVFAHDKSLSEQQHCRIKKKQQQTQQEFFFEKKSRREIDEKNIIQPKSHAIWSAAVVFGVLFTFNPHNFAAAEAVAFLLLLFGMNR